MNCCFHCFQCLCTTTSSSDGGVSTTTTSCSYSCCFDYIKSGNPLPHLNKKGEDIKKEKVIVNNNLIITQPMLN
jgi:hypothetical protein